MEIYFISISIDYIYIEDKLYLDPKNSLDDSTDKASECSKILFNYISEKYGIDWSKESL